MVKNPNYVKKSTSNTEFEFKFDKNHSQLPFSMVFVDLDIVDLVTFLRNKYVTVEGVKIGSRI